MISTVAIIILISVAIGFAATLISGLIKLIFYFKQHGAYKRVLKFGLLGEIVGLLIMAVFILLCKETDNCSAEFESIIAIPIYFMLAGVMTGFILQFHYGLKTKN